MTTQNLTTARFVLQSLLQELEAFDRDIPVARNIQVGDVTDALMAVLTDRQVLRLTMSHAQTSRRRMRMPRPEQPAAAKRKSRVSRTA
jgi:hypothetical protein